MRATITTSGIPGKISNSYSRLASGLVMLIMLLAGSCAPAAIPPTPTATRLPVTDTLIPDPITPVPSLTPTKVPTLVESPPPEMEKISFSAPKFDFYGVDPTQPILTNQPSSEITNSYINPGAVIYHDGQYHMFFNSFTQWPGLVKVGYATSIDGENWSMVQDAPVFTTDQIPFARPGADISSVVVLEDGTWVLYFHSVNKVGAGAIGLATADSPLGPWKVQATPILEPGSKDTWDAFGVTWPSVVATQDGFAMFYGGLTNSRVSAIGLATSPDGYIWSKYDDSQTSDALYVESDPVLQPVEEWTNGHIDRMRAQITPDGWVMIYQGDVLSHRGIALSQDGIHWSPYPENPVIVSQDFPISANTWDTAFLYHDGVYRYYMELGSMAGTNIYLAEYTGSLKP